MMDDDICGKKLCAKLTRTDLGSCYLNTFKFGYGCLWQQNAGNLVDKVRMRCWDRRQCEVNTVRYGPVNSHQVRLDIRDCRLQKRLSISEKATSAHRWRGIAWPRIACAYESIEMP